MHFLLQLHTNLFLGLPGRLFLGAMGLLFVAAVVSGIVLYAPFMRRQPFGVLRVNRSARLKWLDYHNLLGIVTIAWVLVVGLTGVVNTLATPIIGLWKNEQFAELAAPGLLAFVSGTGLVVALVGEGVLDVAACVGFAAPLAAIAWAWFATEPVDATMCKV
jgi:hypothetical protein